MSVREPTMTNGTTSAPISEGPAVKIIKLKPVELTPENFKPYGQIVGPTHDGKLFDASDAQLDLSRGIPRFYIMHLEGKGGLSFDNITHHASVTQCLGSIGGHPWYLGVAPVSILRTGAESADGGGVGDAVRSKTGHSYVPPSPEDVQVFRVDGPQFLKLNTGIWHAGPFFTPHAMDFYNLELSDTNEVDHTTHVFRVKDRVVFQIDDP